MAAASDVSATLSSADDIAAIAAVDPTQTRPLPVDYSSLTFDPALDKKYVCPICLGVLCTAVQTSCGHRFCSTCLTTLANDRIFIKCPVDNQRIDTEAEVFQDIAIRREILSLMVLCREEGCTWKGCLQAIQNHIDNCTFEKIPCRYGCGELVRRMYMIVHETLCVNRPTKCKLCNETVSHSQLTKHQVLNCEKFPLRCRLCGQMGVARSEMALHLDEENGDCSGIIAMCKYTDIGCHFQTLRGSLPTHYDSHADVHITGLQNTLAAERKRIVQLEKQIAVLTHRMEVLEANQTPQQQAQARQDISDAPGNVIQQPLNATF